MTNGKMTFGVIVGNRGFFPGHLAQSGRSEMIAALEKAGHRAIVMGPEAARHGAIESLAAEIDGIIVPLPNFGDERAIANTLRWAALPVPVLIQATPDTPGKMTIT